MTTRSVALMLLGLVALDQLSKKVILTTMALGESIVVLPGFFSITSVRNRGGAFGMLAGLPEPWGRVFFIVVSLSAVLIFLVMLLRLPEQDRWSRFALTAMVAGAVGNLYDRIRYGEVVDFLDFYIGGWHYPAFNVADSCIVVAAGVLLLSVFTQSREGTE